MITEAVETTSTDITLVSKMYKDIHGWAVGSLTLGVASLFFNSGWAITLIITAVLSFKARVPQMYRLYAVILSFAAVSNLLLATASEWGWSILGVMQIWWAVAVVRQYRKYRWLPLTDLYQSGNWPEKEKPPQEETRILGGFSKASLILSLVMILLISVSCLGIIVLGFALADQEIATPDTVDNQAAEYQPAADNFVSTIFNGTLSMAVLSFALGIAALVPENPKRMMALAGVIISAFIIAPLIALLAFGSVASTFGITP